MKKSILLSLALFLLVIGVGSVAYLQATSTNAMTPANDEIIDANFITFQWPEEEDALSYTLIVREVDPGGELGKTFFEENVGNLTRLTLDGFEKEGQRYMWQIRKYYTDAPKSSNAPTPRPLIRSTLSEPIEFINKKAMPETIPAQVNIQEWGGANLYDNAGDNPNSIYYNNPDFYNMTSNDHLTIIEKFKTYQQTAEWSCGAVAGLMVLEHFGVSDFNEWDVSVAMGTHTDMDTPGALPGSADDWGERGTSVDQMVNFFDDLPGFVVVESSYVKDYGPDDLIADDDESHTPSERGNLPKTFSWAALYSTDNDPATNNWVEDAADSYFVKWLVGHLEAGRPIMVEWIDWGGHWQVIIGYDNMGTPEIGDDMLIFADPYDTSDHWQDGYYYYPLERWFYMWQDNRIAPKPFQLQPYLVVDVE